MIYFKIITHYHVVKSKYLEEPRGLWVERGRLDVLQEERGDAAP